MYRLGTDWFFLAVIGETKVRIQVTHECLMDKFDSDGTEASDRAALIKHQMWIVSIATQKAMRERGDTIVITAADIPA